MITPEEIGAKAARAYVPFLRAWLRGEPFAPLVMPAGAPPADFRGLERAVAALLHSSKDRRGFGYTLAWHTRETRAHGRQSLPVRIHVPSAEDMLLLIGKTAEFEAFVDDVALIRAALPELEAWLEANPQHVIEQHGAWPDLLRVCAYFCANPRPNLYIPRAADRRPHQIHRAAQAACWKRCCPPRRSTAASRRLSGAMACATMRRSCACACSITRGRRGLGCR